MQDPTTEEITTQVKEEAVLQITAEITIKETFLDGQVIEDISRIIATRHNELDTIRVDGTSSGFDRTHWLISVDDEGQRLFVYPYQIDAFIELLQKLKEYEETPEKQEQESIDSTAV